MSDLLKNFIVSDSFLGRYEKLVKEVVIPYQEKVLKDEIPDTEKSHAIENFRAAAKMLETGTCDDEFYGMVFQDSDVAKWLEAAAYSLLKYPDKELENRCDEVIELIGRAQQRDGYLNTYFTVKMPDKRWTNLEEAHELYCAGHMMEAAVAYAESTGKTKLLNIMSRMADHIYKRFIEEGAEGYPGHPEVELALMRMYRCTKNDKYKELAEHFVNVRGVDSDYFIKESQKYNWTVWGNNSHNKEYAQNQTPVREQTKAVGHAVRAVYLYTGMADVAFETKDQELKNACKTLWDNITQCKMYVTGAIGSAYEGEAFTKDYHLPNDTAYAETCASIGLIFFARKMLDLEKDSRYSDAMERALYNCVLAGMQLDGEKFFYVNPLEVIPGISGEAVTHRHALPQRPKWFACACCPPNVARLLSSVGRYAWSEEGDTVYSHLFIGGTLDLSFTLHGKIEVITEYPYGDRVTYRFKPDDTAMHMTLAIRLPQWSKETVIKLNGKKSNYETKNGYAYLTEEFTAEDEVTVTFDMSVRRIFASGKVSADSCKVAFSRGPLVYCAEGIDNDEDVLSLSVKKESEAESYPSNILNGIVEVKIDGYRAITCDSLYTHERPAKETCKLRLIPYYTWGNRGLNQMRVWIPEEE
ncbi:glycoside hydrolase family 127 protein [Anaerocolumna sp. MB42-C2]|uniref:glycoside hydrolase family 127 protein n=1 Tax=Anaerocolumna sp. MB42-C2 TaxID=3070997 RepID=UPI0027DF68A6|nr:beta-L-arabinofuranosidase domain-containing protein [Anaerocolumna sp. MB42-C2]WMJ90010.1 glycoside hydrolase family 127 protein [Anaerocolumna sp. MB42-C2]